MKSKFIEFTQQALKMAFRSLQDMSIGQSAASK